MKKNIKVDPRAFKEIKTLPAEAQAKLQQLLETLKYKGFLVEPFAKKLNRELFEIRVSYKGQYRSLYGYISKTKIVVLSAFTKKTQKTPTKEIIKAEKRLYEYKKMV